MLYDYEIDWLWVRYPPEEMKYLFTFLFSFLRSGVKAKRGVEFRHSIRNASKIPRKVGTEWRNTKFPLPTLLSVWILREADKKKNIS